jgi:DNA-packaging protein gp3
MALGRPPIYDDPEKLEHQCLLYFDNCKREKKITDATIELTPVDYWVIKPTVTGLALFLGFADKTTLYEYRDKPDFSYSIKRSLTKIEQYHEEALSENNVAGRIFALKNMGWKDKTEQDMNITGMVPIQIIMPADDTEGNPG